MQNSRKQELIGRFYPRRGIHPFRTILEQATRQARRVLDAGCGNGQSFHYDQQERRGSIFGIDSLWRELVRNEQVAGSAAGDLEALPFANRSFDLIFSHDVVEHLRRPEIVFAEFSRVLGPGGKLLILTPNIHHYFAMAGRIIPLSLQRAISRRLMRNEGEVFRTFYRCNSAKRMIRSAAVAGLGLVELRLYEPPPTYMAMGRLTFVPAVLYERLVNRFESLAPFRAQLIGVFQKV